MFLFLSLAFFAAIPLEAGKPPVRPKLSPWSVLGLKEAEVYTGQALSEAMARRIRRLQLGKLESEVQEDIDEVLCAFSLLEKVMQFGGPERERLAWEAEGPLPRGAQHVLNRMAALPPYEVGSDLPDLVRRYQIGENPQFLKALLFEMTERPKGQAAQVAANIIVTLKPRSHELRWRLILVFDEPLFADPFIGIPWPFRHTLQNLPLESVDQALDLLRIATNRENGNAGQAIEVLKHIPLLEADKPKWNAFYGALVAAFYDVEISRRAESILRSNPHISSRAFRLLVDRYPIRQITLRNQSKFFEAALRRLDEKHPGLLGYPNFGILGN